MKKVLVMGGTMFFGKRLVEKLLQQGMEVTIATRGRTADPFADRVERLVIDRENRETLEAAFRGRSWDVVYDQTCYSPQEALDTKEILDGRIGRYIFTSTMAVYDHGSGKREEDFDPRAYAVGKLGDRRAYIGVAGYQEAKRASEAVLLTNPAFPVVAIRFPLVIGPDDFTNRLRFHVEHIAREIPMGISNPDNYVDFISSEDAARTLAWLGESDVVGPFNASSHGEMRLRELVGMIEELVGKKAILVPEAGPGHDSPYAMPGSWSLCIDKIKQAGFAPSHVRDWLPSLLAGYLSQL
ncbi:NAD-dependent epimerase/dehydratase family protein [Brevibacillus sp. SYP-B805]|uniref:NAD-dependent epimerase/dehydratase family protein n=1 Tax=Brevibacillus sp. SYP-B805 TaxID=1578199 RepID=UPI0013EBF979|nr:NAD-dependent epimerase/dehydratase family protein [Brevibacillus sp. SYP-B805]NGQ95382.1 NAD-dependent epimerase/dehydratase family protein [Brevibacillus sp. SYP-B805]